MRFLTISSLLALAATATAIALPLDAAEAPLNGTIEVSVDLPSSLMAKRALGASGTLTYRWISRTKFGASYRLKDTKADSHPVYIETTVYDINDRAKYVLRCNNNNGAGNEIICPEKTYTHGSTVVGIAPHVCVNVQLGSDECATGGTVTNPYR
ncbi:hypothetical protein BU26DRAFT_516501 [Trematosphaeria pertusa]|uniref:Fibronectin type-III domain-containing protein n=1 Tax=Trematosphaeria pertusa TaxID=390896 RepID=A0A6A6INR8_9PLEO|nr:uncharacterized protein BU26DRAFT_516501 [Trematosphaeria pertusa]KAF2251738.1 hypothetical protein BU26DRAFT_516501 [Trematosphaeria pertusa]